MGAVAASCSYEFCHQDMNIDALKIVMTTSRIYHIQWCMTYVLASSVLVL